MTASRIPQLLGWCDAERGAQVALCRAIEQQSRSPLARAPIAATGARGMA